VYAIDKRMIQSDPYYCEGTEQTEGQKRWNDMYMYSPIIHHSLLTDEQYRGLRSARRRMAVSHLQTNSTAVAPMAATTPG